MEKPSAEEMRQNLRAWAVELHSHTGEIPVLVREICTALGVAIEKRESVPQFKAFLELDLANPRRATILLPRKKVGAFERFCVAHELAHHLLFTAFGVSPEGKREYWLHEELCDDFARYLLMPNECLAEVLERRLCAREALKHCDDLAEKAQVPWTQAGMRINGINSDLLFSRIRRTKGPSFEVFSITSAQKRGRGKPIGADSPFGEVLGRAVRLGTQESQTLRGDVATDAMKALSLEKLSAESVELRFTGEEFRLSVHLEGR